MRASTLVLGPLVARCGRARVSLPGGCAIGARPIDLHIKGLERLGAKITQEHGYVEAVTDRLSGAEIVFDKITVTGTEDLLMAATLADGETIMQNCAREPEVADLAALLNAMGAKIEGAGTSTIRVKGVSKLHGARHRIIPDRIEAGTFILAGALTGGDLNVAGCDPTHLTAIILQKLARNRRENRGEGRLRAGHGRPSALQAADMNTEEYPGFPTDMQAQYMALATQAAGTSIITENILRTASCTRRNWSAWALTSRSKAAAPSFAENSAECGRRACFGSARLGLAGACGPGGGWRDHYRSRLSHRPWLRKHRREAESLGAEIRRVGDIFPKRATRPPNR
jgi:UDP-N-acetylglucosamine 1-carboxyvinyltransferase